MAPREFLDCVMREIGPWLGLDEVFVYDDDAGWSIPIHPDSPLQVFYEGLSERVVIVAPIGPVPENACSRVHEILLTYNGLWFETGGLRMALSHGEVVLLHDLEVAVLHTARLGQVVRDMAGIRDAWRQIFQDLAVDADLPLSSTERGFRSSLSR